MHAKAGAMRKILHIDMDAFYASVEQRDAPELKGWPVAVGGSSRRGVVAAASYEARAYGVRSAMPSVVAARRCPQLVFVKARFDVYKDVSRQIRDIFRSYTDLVEPLSLDEAYLDVTEPLKGPPSATLLARCIKRDILETTQLTASAGVSFNKFLAKTASGMNKPDGLTVIRPEEAEAFLAALPIERFHGVGAVTARRMKEIGIYTGADLLRRTEEELAKQFGKSGRYYRRIARGEDPRLVEPYRERKSVGAERTFDEDLDDVRAMRERLRPIAEGVAERLGRAEAAGRTITLKVKYFDFEISTRSRTFAHFISSGNELFEVGCALLEAPAPSRPVRLLGISVSNLRGPDVPGLQLPLPFERRASDPAGEDVAST